MNSYLKKKNYSGNIDFFFFSLVIVSLIAYLCLIGIFLLSWECFSSFRKIRNGPKVKFGNEIDRR